MAARDRTIRRILVALDASADSAAALEAAAGLAAVLGAELQGLYVEDVNLVRLPALSLVTEIDFLSGEPRRLVPAELERHLRRQATRARRSLERAAGGSRVRWSFRTARGRVGAELLAAEADLVTLGIRGHSPKRGPGSTARELLAEARAPVLVLRRGARLGRTVYAVYDGSLAAREAVAVAAEVARQAGAPLTVLATADEGAAARRALAVTPAGGGGEPGFEIRVVPLPGDRIELADTVRREACGLLVVPRSGESFSPEGVTGLVRRVHCPVLVVG